MQKALILIDYINEICHAEGKFGSCANMIAEENIVVKINQVLTKMRQDNCLVIWIIVGFNKNYTDANTVSPIFNFAKNIQALQLGTWGTELLSDLNYCENELIICKNMVNPFYNTNLEHILRANHVDELYIAGVSTDMAVQSCTRDAHDRGYRVNVIGDCCASGSREHHDYSLEMLSAMANIISSEKIIH
ncbi:MAG: cysteine hydrolase [Burkholderiales bacterium]|nr:cysteine hydrolase [Burkholderiales bacterium]